MQTQPKRQSWDIILDVLIESGKYIDPDSFKYSDELAAIKFLNEIPSLSITLKGWLEKLNIERERTTSLSDSLRKAGNEVYEDTDWPDDLAVDIYTTAIFAAPKDSIELAKAHANRAASSLRGIIWLEEGFFDCQMALKFNYPIEERNMLLHRKMSLSWRSKINKEERILETMKEIEDLYREHSFPEDELKLAEYRNTFTEWKSKQQEQVTSVPTPSLENKKLIEETSPLGGFAIKAGQPINENEFIYREKAFAFVPYPDNQIPDGISYNCENCGRCNCLPFPCYDCARVTYCNPTCLEQHESIHKYECPGSRKSLWMNVGIAHLAFRCFLVGFRDVIGKLNELKGCNEEQIWEKVESMKHSNFAYGYTLGIDTGFNEIVSVKYLLQYALTAKMLVVYLDNYTSYFDDLAPERHEIISNMDKLKNVAAAVIMKHIGQALRKRYLIKDIVLHPPRVMKTSYRYEHDVILVENLHLIMKSKWIFLAIFPKLSNLNQSCDPNVRNSFDGSYITVTASRFIDNKEEISNCYGPDYRNFDNNRRKFVYTQNYNLVCSCSRCTNDDNFAKQFLDYKCPNRHCGFIFEFDPIDQFWWLNLTDSIMNAKFLCRKCDWQLLLNPKSLKKYFEGCKNEFDSNGLRSDDMNTELLRYYENVGRSLTENHELKLEMVHTLLSGQIDSSNPKIFLGFANAVADYYNMVKVRFGVFSIEFAQITTYALSVLKTIPDKPPEIQEQCKEIIKILDVEEMKKSYTVLSMPTLKLFTNALAQLDSETEILPFKYLTMNPDGASEKLEYFMKTVRVD